MVNEQEKENKILRIEMQKINEKKKKKRKPTKNEILNTEWKR